MNYQPLVINFSMLDGFTHAGNPFDYFRTNAFSSVHVTLEGSTPCEI